MINDVFVREIPLPPHIRGVTLPNGDGTFSVYINSSLSLECRHEALEHELYHIKHDHHYRHELPVAACEQTAVARPAEKTASAPPQISQKVPPPQDKPKPARQLKTHPAPRWGYVRRGYLIVFDQIQPGDTVVPPPKNQPKNDPRCPRIIQPVTKTPLRLKGNFNIDIWK